MNRKAFQSINYGLFLVGATQEGKYQGCIVNSLHQVTSSMPYKFLLHLIKAMRPIRQWREQAVLWQLYCQKRHQKN